MKIAVFARSTIHHFTSGGMETQLKNLIEGLVDQNYEVTVITTAHPLHLTEDFKENLSKVNYFFCKNTTPGLNPLYFWEKIFYKLGVLNRGVKEGSQNYFVESERAFQELIKANEGFDVVISQSTGAYGVYENLSMPFISIIHGTIKTEIENRWQALQTIKNYVRFFIVDIPKWAYESAIENKKFFDKAARIISVSEQLKASFLKDYPGLADKMVVIPNGVDEKIFHPGKEKYPVFSVLYVGRMEIEKGVDDIIRALKELEELPIEAILIGDGVHLTYFKQLALELNVSEKLRFLGKINNNALNEYYKKAHVFALPSRRVEGHPVTISEAMCSGLPVLSTKKGGLKDLFVDGEEGYFIDNYKSLAEKLKFLYENREALARLSANSHKKGVQKYSRNAMISKYVHCLNSL